MSMLGAGLALICLTMGAERGTAASPQSAAVLTAAEIRPLLDALRAVGRDGAGHRNATRAWGELVRARADQLPAVLAGLDGAGPLAANWIRTVVDAVAERQLRGGGRLPEAELEQFVLDRRHDPRGRRLAFEWLVRVDPAARERLIPGMLDDPSLELRRDAVERLIGEAAAAVQAKRTADGVAIYRRALAAARDLDQASLAADRLRKLGETVDLARQFGYVLRWKLIGPFDNTANRGFSAVYPPEKEIRPGEPCQGKHGPIRWVDASASDGLGKIDFNKAFGEEKAVAGYALTEFVSAKEQEVEVRITSSNGLKLWVNGRQVAAYPIYHSGSRDDQYTNRVKLQPGKNLILLKVCQNELVADWTHEWDFRLRICDPGGNPVLSDEGAARAELDGATNPKSEVRNPKQLVMTQAPNSKRRIHRFGTFGIEPLGFVSDFAFRISSFELDAPDGVAMMPLALFGLLVAPGEWRHFRGTDNTGFSEESGLPRSFGPKENVAWRVPLPGPGPGGPIVAAGRVFVTAASGPRQERLHALAFDAATGKPAWERQLWATGHTIHSPFGGVAAPTPASDGKRVFFFFSSNDLACFDLDGNLQWFRGLAYESPLTRNDVGMASSPLVVGETVVVQMEGTGESLDMGLDAVTGETRWRLPRDSGPAWTSPTLLKGKTPADDLALLQSRSALSAHEPRTGKQVWSYSADCSTLSTVAVSGDAIYLPANGGIIALRHDPSNRQVKVLWEDRRLRCENASPVVHDGRIYTLKSPAILVCGEAATGKVLWQLRLKGSIWATPAIADGHLYVVNHEGLVQVVRLGSEGTVAGTGQLDPEVLASPAVAGGAVFFRSRTHLWRVGKGG